MKDVIQYYITEDQYNRLLKKVSTKSVKQGDTYIILKATVPQHVNGVTHQEFYVQKKTSFGGFKEGVFNTI